MMFETLVVYPHLTVYENIASPLVAVKASREVIDKRVRDLARLLKIDYLLDRKAEKLSGGERQRVALARSLAKDALVYLLDEPFANLDAKIRYSLRTEFKKLKQVLKASFILATGDPLDAMALGDKIIILREGRIIQEGGPVDIYGSPRNLWLLRYITGGVVNELQVVVESGRLSVKGLSESDYRVSSSLVKAVSGKASSGDTVVIASHIDGCRIHRSISECDGILVKARYIGYEYRGSEYIVYAQSGDYIFKSLTTPLEYRSSGFAHGDQVYVCIDSSKLMFFKNEEYMGV